MNDHERIKLEDLIAELKTIRGRHTELVTVMIPAGFNIFQVIRQLEAEKGTAENIKSKSTRKAVIDSLERIMRELKNYKQTPENGLAVFSGNVSEKEGVSDIKVWAVIPPKELKIRLYRCDQVFVVEPLEEMLQTQEIYGLLAIDRQEATIGMLEGKKIEVLRKLTSGVPSKVRAGGQSAQRYHRVTEGLAKDFFRRVAESMKEIFFDMPRLKGLLIGGPIPTKEDFLEDGDLVTKLKEKVIAVKDIGYVDEHGLKLLVESSHDDIAEQEIIKEKKIITHFFETVGKNPSKAVYGQDKVNLAIERGAAEKVLISKKVPRTDLDNIEKTASAMGTELIIISNETPEGEQFYNMTKGYGALLRFAIE